MERLTYREYHNALKQLGISYLGSTTNNPKVIKNTVVGHIMTYSISLLQGNLSGYEICPAAIDSPCRALCLGFTGHARASILAHGEDLSPVVRARLIKTRLFFENRDLFMAILCYEIDKYRLYAVKHGMGFSIRLNCMSDISPLLFHFSNSQDNILDLYSDVQFYDYTKDFTRYRLAERYPNYYICFSYDGRNWDKCVNMLQHGYNIAVVFETDVMPLMWRGYSVISGVDSDLRYLDDGYGKIIYLFFHRPAALYKSGKYQRPNTPFVVPIEDTDMIY